MNPLHVIAGRARWCVITGDSRRVLAKLPAKSVEHVITDPPYSEHVHSKQRRGANLSDHEQYPACFARERELGFGAIDSELMATASAESARVTNRWVLRFSDLENVGQWMASDLAAGLQHVRVGIWVKLNATPQFSRDRPATGAEGVIVAHPPGRKRWNGGGTHAVWTHPIVINRGGREPRLHTTQKPLPLMRELVRLFTDPGDVVLDPFAGSGSTGVACLELGRRFIGIEMDPTFAAIARRRLRRAESGHLEGRAA